MTNEELAAYIFTWLRNRNGGELEDALDDMRVRDRDLAIEELAMILQHKGRPPNWVK